MPMNPQHRPGGLTHFGRYSYARWLRAYLVGSGYDIVEIWPSSARAGQTTDPGLQNRHPGTLNGGPTLEADPVVEDDGFAYDVDGVDDYSQTSDDDELDFGNGEALSVLAWVQFSTTTQIYVTGKRDLDANNEGYVLGLTNSGEVLGVVDDGSSNLRPHGSTDLSDNSVHLIAMTFDGSELKLYADASQEGSESGTIGDLSNSNFYTHGADVNGGRRFKGLLGVRSLVAGTISQSDLQKIYDVGADRSNR